MKKVLSAVLTAALLVSTVPAAFAASDIDGHWAKSYITELHENGIINPSASTGNYGPDDKVTRWEFMRYINRAFGFTEKADISFSDVNSSDIFYETVQIAVKQGYINGVGNNRMAPEGTLTREQLLTDPDQAVDFVRETQLDALAIAIGTSHGAYKFTREPTGEILSIDRVKEIHARLPNTHLVMHGSSSVPQEFLAEIRKFGGEMRETYGVPVKEIQTAIKHGVRKVNVDTDIRLAMTAAIRRFIFENPSEFDPRAFMKAARKAEKEMCKSRYLAFGCEGQGAKIHPIPLDAFARGYSDGTITQKTL